MQLATVAIVKERLALVVVARPVLDNGDGDKHGRQAEERRQLLCTRLEQRRFVTCAGYLAKVHTLNHDTLGEVHYVIATGDCHFHIHNWQEHCVVA